MVEGSRAYTPAMLGIKFHSHLPSNIKTLMAARYMEVGMRRACEDEVRVMAAEQGVWVAIGWQEST